MTVHFFIDSPFPFGEAHGMAASKRRLCYAKGLIAAGDTVEVHCTNKVFNVGEIKDTTTEGTYCGIRYNYISGKTKHVNKILRGLDWHILDPLRSFIYALSTLHEREIVYVYLYPLFLQQLLILACKLKGAKIVKETCEHPSALGNQKSIWHKLCKEYEYKIVMPHYHGFIPISESLNEFINRYKNKKATSIIIPILVEENQFKLDFSKIDNPYNVPYIIHTGTMLEQKDSISKIIKAFSVYKKRYNTNVKLVFTGPHANENSEYIPLMEKLGVRNDIDLLGMVSVEQIAILQHFASLTIIYKSDNLQTRNCFPTKLGEMLASGIPVITTTVGDANLYLRDGINSYIIEPDDENALISKIHSILSDSKKATLIGENGREIAQTVFNPYYQGIRLHNFYETLIEEK